MILFCDGRIGHPVKRGTKHHKWEEWQSRLGTRTFNPLEVIDMQKAIRKRKTFVDVQGRRFLLRYYTKQGEDKVFFRPDGDLLTPCGHLDIRRFLELEVEVNGETQT